MTLESRNSTSVSIKMFKRAHGNFFYEFRYVKYYRTDSTLFNILSGSIFGEQVLLR